LTKHREEAPVWVGTGYGLDSRLSIPGRDGILLLATASRLALGPTQPPIHLVSGAFSREQRGWSVYPFTHLCLVSRLKIRGAVLPFMARCWI